MINGAETAYFVGAHYEVTDGVVTKYYYAGAQRIAMRTNGTLNYLLGDHLGSTSLSTDAAGNVISELRYKAWGEVRYASGATPTDYTYTGQYSYASDFGLMYYNARWYDPSLGRFAQADSIIPEQSQGVQAWDRYAYTNNNPVKYVDPSGHEVEPIKPLPCWFCGMTFSYASASGPFAADGFLNSVLDFGLTALAPLWPGRAHVEPLRDTITFPDKEDFIPAYASNMLLVGADVVMPSAPQLIYKSASGSPKSLTPRPGIDDLDMETGGLSFFDDPNKLKLEPGDKYVVVNTEKITVLDVIYDNNPPGHVSVRPSTLDALQDWALSRNTGQTHFFTDIVQNAIVEIKKWMKE